MGYPVAFHGNFTFHNQELLYEAIKEIQLREPETFLPPNEWKRNAGFTVSFDLESYGPASSYEDTTYMLVYLATFAKEYWYETIFNEEQDEESSAGYDLFECYENLAAEFFDRGEYQSAFSFADKALKEAPDSERSLYIRGAANCALKNYEEGFADLVKVQTPGQPYWESLQLLTKYKIQLMQFRSGIELLDAAIAKSPSTGMLYYLRGQLRLKASPGLDPGGMEDWKKAIEYEYSFLLEPHRDLLGETGIAILEKWQEERKKIVAEEKRKKDAAAEKLRQEQAAQSISRRAPEEKTNWRWLHFAGPAFGILVIIIKLITHFSEQPAANTGGVHNSHYQPGLLHETVQTDALIQQIRRTKTIPAEFWNDERLRVYDRWKLDSFPSGISQLKLLQSLEVFDASFQNMPDSIGYLSKLKKLVFSKTQLTTIPATLANLQLLEELDLSRNPIDSVPDIFAGMQVLRHLDLGSYRGAHGPNERRNLQNVPLSIGSLSSLEYLDLSGNRISSLPDTLRNLHKLKVLNLAGNELDSLPSWIGEFSNLETLYIGDNHLKTLPDSITQLKKLQYIFASGNEFASSGVPVPMHCYLDR